MVTCTLPFNLRYADNTTLMAENKEEPKSLLMRVREEREKAGLKLNINKKTRSLHLAPSLHGKYRGKTWEKWQIFSSWALKSLWMVTVAMKLENDCFLEGKLWHLGSVLKSKDITLPAKVCIVKAMVFLLVMFRCESWVIKKAGCWTIGTVDLWS